MVRTAGIGYRLRAHAQAGERIENLTKLPGGDPIEASRQYVLTGWASVNENVEGPGFTTSSASISRTSMMTSM